MRFRYPKTANEMRASVDVDHYEYVRPKRRKCHIPDSYDDIMSRQERSWKRKRRKQYKAE